MLRFPTLNDAVAFVEALSKKVNPKGCVIRTKYHVKDKDNRETLYYVITTEEPEATFHIHPEGTVYINGGLIENPAMLLKQTS